MQRLFSSWLTRNELAVETEVRDLIKIIRSERPAPLPGSAGAANIYALILA